jgi:hypothetical protein
MPLNAAKSAIFAVGIEEGTVAIKVVKTVVYFGFLLASTPERFPACTAMPKRRRRNGQRGRYVGYVALVDPHLTHGCEVVVGSDRSEWGTGDLGPADGGGLSEVSVRCGQAIHVGDPVHGAEAHTVGVQTAGAGSGVHAGRRAMSRGHYVRETLCETVRMGFEGLTGRFSDVRRVVECLSFGCVFPAHGEIKDAGVVGRVIRKGVRSHLQTQVDASPKFYLLHGRIEQDGNGVFDKSVPVMLRHYLRISNSKHRVVSARVLLSGRPYAIEVLRRVGGAVEMEDWLCRVSVESPEHVRLEGLARTELGDLRKRLALDSTMTQSTSRARRGCGAHRKD